MKPVASERVTKALEAGWSSACNGLAALSWFTMRRRANEGGSMFIDVLAGERKVQIYVSPTGRSVRVYVDGKEA